MLCGVRNYNSPGTRQVKDVFGASVIEYRRSSGDGFRRNANGVKNRIGSLSTQFEQKRTVVSYPPMPKSLDFSLCGVRSLGQTGPSAEPNWKNNFPSYARSFRRRFLLAGVREIILGLTAIEYERTLMTCDIR